MTALSQNRLDTCISKPENGFGPDEARSVRQPSRARQIGRLVLALALAVCHVAIIASCFSHLILVKTWLFLTILLVPSIVILIALAPRSRNHYSSGRRLYSLGRFERARQELSFAMQEEYPDAARLLGDMCLEGAGMPENVNQAAAFYTAALDMMDGKRELVEYFSDTVHAAQIQAQIDAKMPKDVSGWLRQMEERLAARQVRSDAGRAVLAELHARRNDIPGALRHARALADHGGTPTPQAACLARILNPVGAVRGYDKEDEPDAGNQVPATPGVKIRLWHVTRVEIGQLLVFPCFFLLLFAYVGVFGIVESQAFGKVVVNGGILFSFWLIHLIGRRDRFPIGERHYLAGRYRQAAKIFSKQYAKGEPRSAKRLGDMHLHGFGVERNREKAVAAYGMAFYGLKASVDRWVPGFPFPFASVPGLTDDPEAREKWHDEIFAALEIFAAEGCEMAHDLRVVMSSHLERHADHLRYARALYEFRPSPDNELALANAAVEYSGSSPGELEAGLAILRRRFAEGEHRAALTLIDHYSGRLGKKDAANRSIAVAVFREYLRRAREGDFGKNKTTVSLLLFACRLAESFGGGAVKDEEIVDLMKLRREWLETADQPDKK